MSNKERVKGILFGSGFISESYAASAGLRRLSGRISEIRKEGYVIIFRDGTYYLQGIANRGKSTNQTILECAKAYLIQRIHGDQNKIEAVERSAKKGTGKGKLSIVPESLKAKQSLLKIVEKKLKQYK